MNSVHPGNWEQEKGHQWFLSLREELKKDFPKEKELPHSRDHLLDSGVS